MNITNKYSSCSQLFMSVLYNPIITWRVTNCKIQLKTSGNNRNCYSTISRRTRPKILTIFIFSYIYILQVKYFSVGCVFSLINIERMASTYLIKIGEKAACSCWNHFGKKSFPISTQNLNAFDTYFIQSLFTIFFFFKSCSQKFFTL